MGEFLRREVEPPEQRQTGVGIMLVASACMFFAVASSAFLLRAQVAQSCHTGGPQGPATIVVQELPPPPDCGHAVFESAQNGVVTLKAQLCPGQTATVVAPAPSTCELGDCMLAAPPLDGYQPQPY